MAGDFLFYNAFAFCNCVCIHIFRPPHVTMTGEFAAGEFINGEYINTSPTGPGNVSEWIVYYRGPQFNGVPAHLNAAAPQQGVAKYSNGSEYSGTFFQGVCVHVFCT